MLATCFYLLLRTQTDTGHSTNSFDYVELRLPKKKSCLPHGTHRSKIYWRLDSGLLTNNHTRYEDFSLWTLKIVFSFPSNNYFCMWFLKKKTFEAYGDCKIIIQLKITVNCSILSILLPRCIVLLWLWCRFEALVIL